MHIPHLYHAPPRHDLTYEYSTHTYRTHIDRLHIICVFWCYFGFKDFLLLSSAVSPFSSPFFPIFSIDPHHVYVATLALNFVHPPPNIRKNMEDCPFFHHSNVSSIIVSGHNRSSSVIFLPLVSVCSYRFALSSRAILFYMSSIHVVVVLLCSVPPLLFLSTAACCVRT